MRDIVDSVLFSVLMVLLAFGIGFALGFNGGRNDIIDQCKGYASFKLNDKERMICVVKPDVPMQEGSMNYMRPTNSKVIKPKVM